MKNIAAIVALCFSLTAAAFAGTLSAADAEKLRAEIAALTAALERGDPEPFITKTHPSLHALMGGKESFEQITRQAVTQLPQSGVKFLSSTVGTPTRTYPAGDEEVCFVPKSAVMEVQGKKAKSTNFMIAIRPVKGGEWHYLDGAGLRQNPEMLYQLLPKLEQGIELPENTVELL
ncbi:MAG TPA: hypothetical protein VJS12_21535 [Steroidobacteraceae bacterium]|nr:hypothetical protein [Steroidobacteraceae bacterium]